MDVARLYRTLKDIPLEQLAARFVYEAKLRTLTKLPVKARKALLFAAIAPTPPLRKNYLKALYASDAAANQAVSEVSFFFLNEARTLSVPIPWRSDDFSRLWQFNLQHFDHWRTQLNELYKSEREAQDTVNEFATLIDDWIDANPVYTFEGWHAFAVSLRIVAWSFALSTFPALANDKVKDSLWEQLVFLGRNLETFASGNHLLENLRALIVGSLVFEGKAAEALTKRTLKQLTRELKHQVLNDGGHSERSTSYHLRMMNLLAEVIAALKSAGWAVPAVFSETLAKMTAFALAMRLSNGLYSLFNDASYDASPSIDESVSWSLQLLDKPIPEHLNADVSPLFARLLESANAQTLTRSPYTQKNLDACDNTGYYFLRSPNFELSFDAALPCPRGIPGHAHADALHFELYYQGQALFSDTGSSEYKNGPVRSYERSTLGHNTIEFAHQDQSEMWGSFRIGRKAKPYHVLKADSSFPWLSAAHDGYKLLGASHHRLVALYKDSTIILDVLEATQDTPFISQFHLHPQLSLETETATRYALKNNKATLDLKLELLGLSSEDSVSYLDEASSSAWYVPVMGKRIPRASLRINGKVTRQKVTCLVISPQVVSTDLNWQDNKGKLSFDEETLSFLLDNQGLRLS